MQIGESVIYFDREGKGHDALVELPAADASGRVDLLYVNDGKKSFLGSPDFHLALVREGGVQMSEKVEDKKHCYANPRQVPAPSDAPVEVSEEMQNHADKLVSLVRELNAPVELPPAVSPVVANVVFSDHAALVVDDGAGVPKGE